MKCEKSRRSYIAPLAELWEMPQHYSFLRSLSSDLDATIGAIEGEEDFI